jgi:hypothetical protein
MLQFYDAAHDDMRGAARQFSASVGRMGTGIPKRDLEMVYLGTYGGPARRRTALDILAAHADDDWTPTLLLQLGEPARSLELFEHGSSGLSDGYLNWLWQPEPWSRMARREPAFQGFARRIGMVDYWKRNGWPDLCKALPSSGPDAFACD